MMTQKEQIEEAKYCIEVMKRIGTFRNHKIGIARDNAGITLIKGYVVLYREEEDGTLTTEHACNKEWIEENLKKGNLNTTGSTCINVPRSFIIPWHSKYEKILTN